mgnify:CR=1 FL=1
MSSKYVNIEGNPNLVRDNNTNAILSVDNKSLENYRHMRALNRRKTQQYESINQDIDNLKKDIMEIKDLLLKITRD